MLGKVLATWFLCGGVVIAALMLLSVGHAAFAAVAHALGVAWVLSGLLTLMGAFWYGIWRVK
jgi:uncharacterized membrane protein HdeD (DUF308 family)